MHTRCSRRKRFMRTDQEDSGLGDGALEGLGDGALEGLGDGGEERATRGRLWGGGAPSLALESSLFKFSLSRALGDAANAFPRRRSRSVATRSRPCICAVSANAQRYDGDSVNTGASS
jgi:hypothetical protein